MMDVTKMEKELAALYNKRSANLLNMAMYGQLTKEIYALRERLNEAIFGKVDLSDDAEF